MRTPSRLPPLRLLFLLICVCAAGFGALDLMASDIECVFTPKVDPSAYTINIANDIMMTLTLNPKKSCVIPLSLSLSLALLSVHATFLPRLLYTYARMAFFLMLFEWYTKYWHVFLT